MINVVAIVGESGSGKNHYLEEVMNDQRLEYNRVVSTTTRPMRPGEVDGVDYNFISNNEFFEMVSEDIIIAPRTFKGTWNYGIDVRTFKENLTNIVIVDPSGLKDLKNIQGIKTVGIYINTPEDIRIKRLKYRGDDLVEVRRRLGTDKEDFKNIFDLIDIEIKSRWEPEE